MKNTAAAFILVLFILTVSFQVPVSSQGLGCLDNCQTGCVQRDPRLQARCDRKCQIRCGPDGAGQNSGGNV